jgi:uncharacterized protein YpuA (DUF1002 family)
MKSTATVGTTSDNSPIVTNTGDLMMSKPTTLTVLATSAGVPTAGVTVRALSATSGTLASDFFSAVTGSTAL